MKKTYTGKLQHSCDDKAELKPSYKQCTQSFECVNLGKVQEVEQIIRVDTAIELSEADRKVIGLGGPLAHRVYCCGARAPSPATTCNDTATQDFGCSY